MENELLATYYYMNKAYNVYGCWDEETPENEYEFYDIYDDNGDTQICLNEGSPYYELPIRDDVIKFIESN